MALSLFRSPEQKDLQKEGERLQAQFNSLREDEANRLQRYVDHTEEYERVRSNPIKDKVADYGRKTKGQELQRHYIPLGYDHAIITKHQYRIAGRLPDLISQRLDNSKYQLFRADAVEKILYGVYDASGAEQQFADGAHDGSLLGASCFEVYFDPSIDQPRFRAVNPRHVVVVPGLDEPHDFERCYYFWHVPLASFRARYGDGLLPDGTSVDEIKADGPNQTVCIVQMSTKTRRVRFAAGHILEPPVEHNYGFTPYVAIPNLGPARNVWGYSDYEFIRHIVAYFETVMSRQADVIRATANGAYLAKGVGQGASKIKQVLQEGGVAPARDQGSVEAIQPAEFGAGFVEHVNFIRAALDDIGFTPPAAWGALGASSGSDRALQMAPQVELTALKQINWSAGLRRLNTMILKLVEQKSTGKSTFSGTKTRGQRVTPFRIVLNAGAQENFSLTDKNGQPELDEHGDPLQLPMNPADLIDRNYETRVVWERRLDRDDPEFILAELNKFSQGAQSLRTTLERFGIEAPEDEMRLIEEEAERFPWLRQGMVALINAELANQEGAGGGGGGDIAGALSSLMGGGGGASGALTGDAMARGLNGSSNGGKQRSGAPSGSKYGAA